MENTFNTGKEVEIAEEPEGETYDWMPITDFGKQMMYQMGWRDGENIGKNK